MKNPRPLQVVPSPDKNTESEGSFQLLGVRALHLEASVQPLMTRHGDVECALFLELRRVGERA